MDVYYSIAHYNYMNEHEKAQVRELARRTWRSKKAFVLAKDEFCHNVAYVTLTQNDFDRYRQFMKTKYGYTNFVACRRDIEKVEGIWQTWLKTIAIL